VATPPTDAAVRQAQIRALVALLEAMPGACTVTVSSTHINAVFHLPAPDPTPAAAPPASVAPLLAGCRADLWQVLADAGERLTCREILVEMRERGMGPWDERTVRRHLAGLQASGHIDHDGNANPPGYGVCQAPAAVLPVPRGRPLSDMEADVLQAVAEAGGEMLTGERIGQLAGYPFDSHLRVCLAALRREGLLSGEPGVRGYRMTDKGRAVLDAHQADDRDG
jgi:hypothetical protein